ncbi:hypothetical protein TNCV_2908131 [Trichonephila clavipes]|nr:hypothetical protein TNCV_2908131 [Trichonephila clavipes]
MELTIGIALMFDWALKALDISALLSMHLRKKDVSEKSVTFSSPSCQSASLWNIHHSCILHLHVESYCVVCLGPPPQPLEPEGIFPANQQDVTGC